MITIRDLLCAIG